MVEFTSQVFQNEYLPEGGTDVNAIVAVRHNHVATNALNWAASQILAVDISASMSGDSFSAAKNAATTALDQIPDGTNFALIAGSHRAELKYPSFSQSPKMTLMSSQTRQGAKEALASLTPDGGTAMGTWLKLAKILFDSGSAPDPRHLLILSDGGNHNETPPQLSRAIEECSGLFKSDCLSLGKSGSQQEMQAIATAFGGKVTPLPSPEQIEALLTLILRQHHDAGATKTQLKVWLPLGAKLLFLRQVAPEVLDISGIKDGQVTSCDLLDWGIEEREFHLGVRLPPQALGREQLTARVQLFRNGETLTQALVKAKWAPVPQITDAPDIPLPSYAMPRSSREHATTVLREEGFEAVGEHPISQDSAKSHSPDESATENVTTRLRLRES